MGRHTAADDAAAHPLVAEALAVRPVDGGHRHALGIGTPVGWQGTPEGEHLPGGGGLGWPDGLPAEQTDGADGSEAQDGDAHLWPAPTAGN